MRRHVIVAFALVASLLVVSATPAAAATNPAFGAINTSDSDFASADTLDGLQISGSGDAAYLEYRTDSEVYDAISDSSDGTVDAATVFVGDDSSDTPRKTEVEIEPTVDNRVHSLNVTIGGTSGSDYGATVDVYLVEGSANSAFGEGTKVATWDPDWQTGEQKIQFDSPVNVSGNTTYTVEFVTSTSDNDGSADSLSISKSDESGFDISYPLFTLSGGIGAISLYGKAINAQYVGDSHAINRTTQGFVNVTAAKNVSYQVAWENESGDVLSSSTYTSAGKETDSWATIEGGARANITVSKTGLDPEFNLADEGVFFENRDPSITNVSPSDGTQLTTTDPTFNATVSDSDFATLQGDSLSVSLAIDGTTTNTTTVASNESASFDPPISTGGEHSYEWTVSDDYGGTTTQSGTVSLPNELVIRNESDPSEIINVSSGTAEVQFFGDDGAVYSRPIEDGTASFAGLPVDQRFTAVIDANGYKSRRVIIDSLIDQQTAFVQPTDANSVEVIFEINSPTGQFPPDETILFIDKPITLNNNTEYRTIAADTFGASGQYPANLITGTRYRLRVETIDGSNSRVLGSYTPIASKVETLQIQRVEPRSDVSASGLVYGGLTSYDNNTSIAVRHRDIDGESVDSVEYRIVREDGTVVVSNTTTTADQYAAVYPINVTNTTNFTVQYTVTFPDGTTEAGSFSTGVIEGPTEDWPIDSQLLSIISWVAILATMGLLVIVNTTLAPIGGVAMATGLTVLGTIAIPMPILGIAGVLGALNAFGGGGGQ